MYLFIYLFIYLYIQEGFFFPTLFSKEDLFFYNFSLLALRIMGIALRLARQCPDNGPVMCWLKNSPGNMDL